MTEFVTPISFASPMATAAPTAAGCSSGMVAVVSFSTTVPPARAESGHVEPTGESGKEARRREGRVASADFGAVRKHGNAPRRKQGAKTIEDALRLGLGHPQEDVRNERRVTGVLDEFQGGQRLGERFGRRARFRNRDKPRLRNVENAQAPHKGAGIEVAIEAKARALFAGRPIISGDRPAPELSERLSPKARPACAEDQNCVRARRQFVIGGAGLLDAGGVAQDAEMGEASVLRLFFQSLETRRQQGEPLREAIFSQTGVSDL